MPELAAVIDRLDRDHARGERAVRELEHTLLAFEVMGESRREAFEQALTATCASTSSTWASRKQFLPAARAPAPADWAALDAAFAANRDPLTGHEPDDVYRPLFSKIMTDAPAPFGPGPAG